MARYRKLLIVSPIGLAAIVMALYSQSLVEWNPEQNQPVYAVSEPERADKKQASSQAIPAGNSKPEVQPVIEDHLITGDSQAITTVSNSITLSGWVGTEFGENIAGEVVILYSSTLRAYYSINTSSSGEYIFTGLKPSYDYAIKVSPQGLFKRYTKFPIKLRSNQEVHNIVLESIPLGILTGGISDPYGRPVTGIELLIQTAEIDYWSANVITDANGSFSVDEFPKGRFQLSIKGQQLLNATGLKFDPDTSESVCLTIDYGPYYLSGRIYDASGQTFDGADVSLNWALQENGVRIRSTRQTNVDANGEFRFTGLGPGDHELVVTARWGKIYGQMKKQTIRQTVNVGVDPGELNIFFK